MGRTTQQKPRRAGRPPSGARAGEKVKDYPQISIRLPPDLKATLRALSVVDAKPQWRIVIDAIACLMDALPESKRRQVHDIVRRGGRAK